MPFDPTSDPDFMAAAPSDQMKYLAHADQDFAAASPQDQLGYLAHIRGVSPISGPSRPIPPELTGGPSRQELALGMYGGPVGEVRANPTLGQAAGDVGTAAAAGAGIAAGAASLPAVGAGIAGVAARHPVVSSMIASELIGKAREIPVAGKFIPPYAEVLPWLMSGGGKGKLPQTAEEMQGALGKGAAEVPSTENLTPVQIGKFAKETGNPYAFKNTPPMNLVDSTNITKTGYHPDSKTMVMEFRNGKVYEYRGVPQQIYDQFQKSESAGSFFARQIKGRYETNYRGSVLGKK